MAALQDAQRTLDLATADINLSYTLRSLHRFGEAGDAIRRAPDLCAEMGRDSNDEWFQPALGAVDRHEVDIHEHRLAGR